jgi:hypothetical protein
MGGFAFFLSLAMDLRFGGRSVPRVSGGENVGKDLNGRDNGGGRGADIPFVLSSCPLCVQIAKWDEQRENGKFPAKVGN